MRVLWEFLVAADHLLRLFILLLSLSLDAWIRCVCVCPPVLQKACAVRPVLARVVGKLGGADPGICSKEPWKEMLGQGRHLRLLDEAREMGHHQHPGPENQDSQHMLNQPTGPGGLFPSNRTCKATTRRKQIWIASDEGVSGRLAMQTPKDCLRNFCFPHPKDPAVLKALRRSKFTMRSNFTIARGFTMATTPALAEFSWNLQAFIPSKRGSRRSKSGGRSKNIASYWKSKFLYRYRPEGIFRIFFGLILDPPRYICFYRRKPKRDGGKGTAKKASRQFTTIYDILRHFMTISVSLSHWHKAS